MSRFETIRAFAALNVEVAAVRRIAVAAERLRVDPAAPPMRWVPPTKMHVTLRFFGEIDIALAPAIRDGLAALAKERPAPRITFASFSAFPSLEAAQVIFADAQDMGDETASLAAAVDRLGESLGLPRETRTYHPHLTLGRTRAPTSVGPWLAAAPTWRVVALAPELALYRSDLARPGAEYDTLGRFALAPRKSSKKSA